MSKLFPYRVRFFWALVIKRVRFYEIKKLFLRPSLLAKKMKSCDYPQLIKTIFRVLFGPKQVIGRDSASSPDNGSVRSLTKGISLGVTSQKLPKMSNIKLHHLRSLILKASNQNSIWKSVRHPKQLLKKIHSLGIGKALGVLSSTLKGTADGNNFGINQSLNAKTTNNFSPYNFGYFNVTLDSKNKSSVFMITDGIDKLSLFGGVLTALIYCAQLAEKTKKDLKIILTSSPHRPTNFHQLFDLFGISRDLNVEFIFRPEEIQDMIRINRDDVFVPTSSWTCLKSVRSFPNERIFYILQEDERLFFPSGDRSNLAQQAMSSNDIKFIINTESLRTHLINSGLHNLKKNSVSFEPAFKPFLEISDTGTNRNFQTGRKILCFYARPNHERNMYMTGMHAIQRAIDSNILDPEKWEVHLIGINHSLEHSGFDFPAKVIDKMDYLSYARYLKNVHVGMAFMASPHPGYPALDFVAAGAKSITNSWPGKINFEEVSDSILLCDGTIEGIVAAIQDAIEMIECEDISISSDRIKMPYSHDWKTNMRNALQFTSDMFDNV